MLVLARAQDFVAVINSTLRNAGLAAHCTWVKDSKALVDALAANNVEMLIAFVGSEPAESSSVMQIRNQAAPDLPVIFVRDKVDEDIISAAMQLGARDVVTLASRARLQAVVAREVRSYRTECELAALKNSAKQSQDQMKAIVADTTDAIAFVQEGIVVEVNPAWVKAFRTKSDALVGHPLMDMLDPAAQPLFKTALSACLQNKGAGAPIKANIVLPDRSLAPLEFRLARGEYDGEPAVRLSIVAKKEERAAAPAPKPAAAPAPVQPAAESGRDAATGLWQRKPFVERLQTALSRPPKAGIRQILALEPDQLAEIETQLVASTEDFVTQLAALLGENFKPGDLVGRFGDCTLVALVERGTTRDVDAMLQHALSKTASHVFHVAGKSVMCTLSAGVSLLDSRATDANAPISDVLRALSEAHGRGGNQVQSIDRAGEDTKMMANDAIWVQAIKHALDSNRFKLLQQPIATLLGEEQGMVDMLVRMIDESGNDVLPAEFMGAAERNGLMKNVDRWMISQSMALCAAKHAQRVFVRLSLDSIRDKSLPQWLMAQLKSTGANANQVALQLSETVASEYMADATSLSKVARHAGFKIAIEHFGSGRDSARLLKHVGMDYVKIDGSLMQNLASNADLQKRVKELVEIAHGNTITTIAERVDNANTMAVLWQFGIGYIQGYFVNEPEQVVMAG